VKPVIGLKLCLIAPAAHPCNPAHEAASTVHDRRREPWQFMLTAKTFKHGFEVAGTL
jgi:hypothetical protein